MFGGWLDFVRLCVALLFAGAAVKMMDDALDVDFDLCRGKRTLAARLGRASLPYSLVSFAIACAAHLDVALAVFFGSYAVGMFTRSQEQLPSRVPAYVEIGGAILLLIVLVGFKDTLWGVAMMSMVDWLDDVMDRFKDRESGQFNVVIRFGLIEVLFAILITFSLALYAQLVWTIAALIALALLNIFFDLSTKKLLDDDAERMSEPW